ncbi:MAG: FAD-dependent monooxygenase [Betaproteobacteria bacterium]|nr:FAD-dependent monooxygenase [Betaproteobacteria bacterium]
MSEARAVVLGGGAVGLAFAAAAAAEGMPVRVLEGGPSRPAADPDLYDARVFALSPGTRAFLEAIGAWRRIPADRIAEVRRMDVRGDDGASRLDFESPEGRPLSWIVEGNRLARALAESAAANGAALEHGIAARSLQAGASGIRLERADGAVETASLLVGADGVDSWTRTALGLASTAKRYPETALVANFRCEKPTGGVARQWFRQDGILAWLPLPGDRLSIVWSARGELARDLAALEPAELARRVRDAGGAEAGEMVVEGTPAVFALRLVRVPRVAVAGAVLIGDAAHGVHPLAGQGVNLGFQDAKSLADTLARRSPLERPGDLALLRRHERARRADVDAMQFVTDRLEWLFALEAPLASRFRNAGLRLVDAAPLGKRLLAAHAMQ